MRRSCRFTCGLAFFALAVGLCPARADDVESVKKKLYQAKKDYDGETRKFRKAVTDWLNKREADARRSGNKKLLDQLKDEQAAFENGEETPAKVPSMLQDQLRFARGELDKTYAAAVKAYVLLKEDKLAAATEKEQLKVVGESALLYGRRTYPSQLKPFDVQVHTNWYDLESKVAKIDGKLIPHSIMMHPEPKTFSNVSFNIGPKSSFFHAMVGVPSHRALNGDPESPLTFEVLGDGKSLWKSEPVDKRDALQTCLIRVEKVRVLSLRVHCSGGHIHAHGTWFGPVIAE